MMQRHSVFSIIAAALVLFSVHVAHAGTLMSDRVAVEVGVMAQVNKDLALPYNPGEALADRHCLDGRPAKDFQGDLVEYWVNLECSYCGIREPLQAQRAAPDMCIVVRHIPTDQYGESLKKALSYEALKKFSPNAANLFWDKVLPQTALGIPVPYEASLMLAFQEAAIAPEAFGEALKQFSANAANLFWDKVLPQTALGIPTPYEASLLLAFQEAAITPEAFGDALSTGAADVVNEDILAGYGRIASTPTYILAGIRFPSCDFTATQLRAALAIAKQARAGDQAAQEKIVTIITNGQLDEKML